MEHAMQALVVLTLLQLCRAEISDIVPGTWFAANGINDGYSPKPIAELFSTEPPPSFSPTKPIIVLPSFSPRQNEFKVTHLSESSPNFLPSSTPYPSSSTSFPSSSTPFPPSSSPYPQSSTPFPPSSSSFLQSSTPFPSTSFAYTSTPYATSSVSITNSPQSSTTASPTTPFENFPVFFPNSQTPSPHTQFTGPDLKQRGGKTSIFDSSPTLPPRLLLPETQTPSPPNYLVIYQNTPQSVQSYPQQSQFQTSPDLTKGPIRLTSTTPLTPIPTVSETLFPFFTGALSDGTSRPTITFRSTPPTIPGVTTPLTTLEVTRLPPTTKITPPPRVVTTHLPTRVHPGPPQVPFLPNLKIRVVAPKGSITNIKINPTTTTKQPRTKRTKKPKKNTLDMCLDACKGKKDHLCAVPLGTIIVDPKVLKGFPSICHMACHNSFKKDPYEKLIDGRCGRIRTRIIRVDTKTKIHREELKKSEYSVINTGPKAVIEFAGANIKKRNDTPSN